MAILFDWYELPEPKDKQREEKILHPRIRLNGSTTTDELRRRIQDAESCGGGELPTRGSCLGVCCRTQHQPQYAGTG